MEKTQKKYAKIRLIFAGSRKTGLFNAFHPFNDAA
jgi:hypothetical protein